MTTRTLAQTLPSGRTELLTNEQAADYLGVTPRTLEVWRCTKRHVIAYIKVGRLVKYRRSELDAWLVAKTIGQPTSEAP